MEIYYFEKKDVNTCNQKWHLPQTEEKYIKNGRVRNVVEAEFRDSELGEV